MLFIKRSRCSDIQSPMDVNTYGNLLIKHTNQTSISNSATLCKHCVLVLHVFPSRFLLTKPTYY